jgi:hypothetical protein
MLMVLFGLFCAMALYAPENPMLERLLPFLA